MVVGAGGGEMGEVTQGDSSRGTTKKLLVVAVTVVEVSKRRSTTTTPKLRYDAIGGDS